MRETVNIRELSESEMVIFLALEGSTCAEVDGLINEIQKTNGGWVLKAIQKRFEAHELKVENKVMIAVLSIGDGIVGKCAKYVDDLAKWCTKSNQKSIDWNTFTKKIYPQGIPCF